MDEQDMDDPVVHEVDVYLSRTLENSLFMLQYPLRRATMPISPTEHTHTKIKPQQKAVEIGLTLDTSSVNYCMSRGEQFAVNAGADNPEEQQPYFRRGVLDTQILRSVASPVDMNIYAVAVIKGEEVHFTPLHALSPLHPTLDYMDMAKSKSRADAAARETAAGDSSQDEEEGEAEAVTVKFAPQESEEAKARRLGSCDYMYRQAQEEPWCPLTYRGANDKFGMEQELQLMYAAHSGEKQEQFRSSASEYLSTMLPERDSDDIVKPEMPDSVLTLQRLRQMPTADSVKALLMNVKVMRFSQLMEMLPGGTDPLTVLRVLQQVAVMVQGCWVVKSEVLYPSDSCSPYSGVAAEHLIRGRDYVMWKFTHCKYVVRKEIAVGLSSEDVKDILEQMSKIRSSKGWEFVFDYDREFVEKHTDVVLRQRQLWDSKYQALCQYFKIPKDADRKAKEAEQILMMQNVERPRRRRASSRSSPRKRTLSGRSMSDMSDWDMETDAAGDRHHNHAGVNHADSVAAAAAAMEISGEDNLSSEHTQENSISNGSVRALDFGDSGDSAAPESEELKRELVELAREAMLKIPVLKFSMLKQHYLTKRTDALRDGGGTWASGVVSDKMLKEAVLAAGGVQVNKMVVSRSDTDSSFVYLHQGNRFDKAREILLSLFESTNKVKSTVFISKVKESGEDYSEAELKKLIRELCESKNGVWYLKGTAPKS